MFTFGKNFIAGEDANGSPLYFGSGFCLSSDEKPTDGIANGSKVREMDTGKDYRFDLSSAEWIEQPSGGGGGSAPAPYTDEPQMDGATSAGSSANYARGDHRHPSDTAKQNTALASAVTIGGQTYTTVESAIAALAAAQATDGVPIGEIVLHSGTTAPSAKYLVCDGTAVNIADYPALAQFFADNYGSANYFGGDGTTTFAVPDWRGEFFRAAGTNSRTGQGDGAAVGVHQDSTEIPALSINVNNKTLYTNANGGNYSTQSQHFITQQSVDAWVSDGSTGGFTASVTEYVSGGNGIAAFRARPTNTSLLACIKALP